MSGWIKVHRVPEECDDVREDEPMLIAVSKIAILMPPHPRARNCGAGSVLTICGPTPHAESTIMVRESFSQVAEMVESKR